MNKSAIILAGGLSKRYGTDKGLVLLQNKPLIRHVIDRVFYLFEEIIVVVSSTEMKIKLRKLLDLNIKIIIDEDNFQSPLNGTITGFNQANSEYSFLISCDNPLVSPKIVNFLLKNINSYQALIPKWPNGYIEPLHAVYHTKSAKIAAKKAYKQGFLNMKSMINNLKKINFISTEILRRWDPTLQTFINVNTPEELKRITNFLLDN